jgi:YHS domain-containing protein
VNRSRSSNPKGSGVTTRILATLAVVMIPMTVNAADPALGGNCPVCLVETGKAVPGSAKHTTTFDRQVYYFPSAKEKEMFLANPVKYAPALGGDCVVCRVNAGVRMPGTVEFAVVHDKRAYLFPSAKERDAFKADPKKYEAADVGLSGYCAVCVLNAKKWVAGKAEFVSVYDGVRYFFPGADEKKAFETDPAKFTPALGGDCVVCLKDTGKRVVGSPKFSATHEGRLYLFPDEGTQKTFLANPKKYASMDVAGSGNCVVCAKMAKKDVPGKAEFTSVYKGQRYLFPSAKERAVFDADPAAFAGTGMKLGAAPAGNPNAITVTGKTACAGCAYGVRPIADPDSLGMAVGGGETVYVVEGAERSYPELFKVRSDGLTVELKGAVKKTQGKFVWIEPTSITRTR